MPARLGPIAAAPAMLCATAVVLAGPAQASPGAAAGRHGDSAGRDSRPASPRTVLLVHYPSTGGPPQLVAGPARLVAEPAHPSAGTAVRLQVLGGSAATDYDWDLDGSGRYAQDTGATPSLTHVFAAAGFERVAVRVTGATGPHITSMSLIVTPAATAPPPAHRVAAGRGSAPARHVHPALHVAHVAGDPPVTIADFSFAPSPVTIHAGDTITWTNNGPSAHTATASDGSFDTGTLSKGQSASHTFTTPGTFAYVCQIHPFMHGKVVVLAAPAAATPAPSRPAPAAAPAASPSAPAAPTSPASTAAAGPSLPLTGFGAASALWVGIALAAAGLALRRAGRPGRAAGPGRSGAGRRLDDR